MAGRNERDARGFTMLELMVILAIVGILAALSYPSLRGLTQRLRLASVSRTVYGAFVDAQAKARTTGIPHRIEFDKANRRVLVESAADPAAPVVLSVASLEAFSFKPGGYPEAFPAPYSTMPRNAWCTFCGENANEGFVEFDSQGLLSRSSNGTTRGSIAIYDPSGAASTVEALLFVGRTGDIRLFRWK